MIKIFLVCITRMYDSRIFTAAKVLLFFFKFMQTLFYFFLLHIKNRQNIINFLHIKKNIRTFVR